MSLQGVRREFLKRPMRKRECWLKEFEADERNLRQLRRELETETRIRQRQMREKEKNGS
jgi:hypothetical protein